MAINLTYRLLQKMAGGPNLCLFQSNSKGECLRKRMQLIRANPGKYGKWSLIVRVYPLRDPEAAFGDGTYGY